MNPTAFRRPLPSLFALALTLPIPVSAQERVEPATRFEPALQELFALDLAPGLAVAVVRGDAVVYRRGFGHADAGRERPIDADTVFYIASATKSFTGMAAAVLHERGDLDLDAPVTAYLQGARFHPDVDPDRISLRDLLTHTHGLAPSGPVSFRLAYSGQHTPDLLRELLAHHGSAATGRRFVYGNIGYNVASMVMDDALGVGWKEVLARELFEPLGMTSTTAYGSGVPVDRRAMPFREEPDGWVELRYTKGDENMHAAGGLMTTAADLARWLEANLNGGRLDGEPAIPAAAVTAAHRPLAEQSATFQGFERTGYGLGWNTGTYDGDGLWHHFGGFAGFHAHVSFMPEHDIGVVMLANSSRLGSVLATLGAQLVYDTLLDRPELAARNAERLSQAHAARAQILAAIRGDRLRRAGRSQQLPRPLQAYAGTYRNPLMGEVTFSQVDGRLEMTMGRVWSAVEVYDADRNALRVEPTGTGQVAFFQFEEGAAAASGILLDDLLFERVDR